MWYFNGREKNRGDGCEDIHQGQVCPAADAGPGPLRGERAARVPQGRVPAAADQRQISGADRHAPVPGGAGAVHAGGGGRLSAHPAAGGLHRGGDPPPPGGGPGPGGVRHRRGVLRAVRRVRHCGAVAGDPPGGVRRGGPCHPGRPGGALPGQAGGGAKGRGRSSLANILFWTGTSGAVRHMARRPVCLYPDVALTPRPASAPGGGGSRAGW